jgi:hypothetical protein
MADAGWVNLPHDGVYEVQQNVFSGAFRHRVFIENRLFHEWFDGKPPYKGIKENNRDN